ncbi:hypothetical protein ACT7C6_30050 [Bacillus paranthracis]
MMWGGGSKPQTPMGTGTTTVPPEVLKWEPTVRKYAQEFGVEPYVPLMLSLIMQEKRRTFARCHANRQRALNTKYPKIQTESLIRTTRSGAGA